MPSWFAPADDVRQAVLRGDLPAVRRFFASKQLPWEHTDATSRDTLFALACGAGHVEIVAYLTNMGWRDFDVHSPPVAAYAFAAMENGHLEVIRWLCEEDCVGLEEDTREHKHSLTLINAAVRQRQTEIVRYLLSRGHKIDVAWILEWDEVFRHASFEVDSEEWPPIECATRVGAVELVDFLWEVGVDVGGQDREHYVERARINLASRLELVKFKRKLEAGKNNRAASKSREASELPPHASAVIGAIWRVVQIPFAIMVAPLVLLLAIPLFLWIKFGPEPKQFPP